MKNGFYFWSMYLLVFMGFLLSMEEVRDYNENIRESIQSRITFPYWGDWGRECFV